MMRKIIAVHSDTHGGCRVGLLNPATILYYEDDNGNLSPYHPKLNESQSALWKYYSDDIEQVKKFAGDDEILLIHNGDMTHGKKYARQLVSTRDADQIMIAAENLRPWYALPNLKHVRIVAGTGAHNFEENSAEIMIAQMMTTEKQAVDTKVIRHGLIEFGGVKVDCAHHGPFPGSRDWLRGNVAMFYLRDMLYADSTVDLVLRSHYHQRVKVMLDWHGATKTLMITPSYCMLDDHALQATRSAATSDIGMYAYEIIDGKLHDILECVHHIDLRAYERI